MRNIGKLVHAALALAFVAVLVSIPLQAKAADVAFTLSWSAPITGGPVHPPTETGPLWPYQVACTDSAGTTVLDVATSNTAAAGNALNVAEGQGTCTLVAFGPGGESPPVSVSFAIGVTLPPGPPQEVTITLQCTVADGVAVCEQV